MSRTPCARPDSETGRLRKCLYADANGCAYDGRRPQAACPHFVFRPGRSWPRSDGRLAIDPTLSMPRVERWHLMLRAFHESTGIAVGTPPDLHPEMNAEGMELFRIPGIGDPDWNVPRSSPLFDRSERFRWPGRDADLLKILQSNAFREAARQWPGRERPSYEEQKRVAELWKDLRDKARDLVETQYVTGARVEARRQREGNHQISVWLLDPYVIETARVLEAAKVLAEAEIPSPKRPKTGGTPKTGRPDALRAIMPVLCTVRCPGGRALKVPELTWLLMLARPERFLDENETSLRKAVETARPASVKRPPRVYEGNPRRNA